MSSPTSASILQPGKRIPNWIVKDSAGEKHVLWDYRQKTHVALVYDPDSTADIRKRWIAAVDADRKQWDWLNVKVIVVASAPEEMTPGVYAIDRYGIFLSQFPASRWSFDDLEREFLYYEAKHC